jgi:LPXTG-motif cell wall-anchored protein
VTTVLALTLAFLLAMGGIAFAQFSGPPGVTITPGGENCNGIIPTPGSENTVKTLIGGTLVPGGTAIYRIAYPVDPSDVGDEWEIVDCVLIGSGTDLKDYTVLDEATFSGVINSTAFVLDFTFSIPANSLIGDRICNVAKTTQGPSAPQSSNRKAGPACFIIGGDARVEKHSTTDPTGTPIPGATFSISNCVNTSLDPVVQPLIINGVSYGNVNLAPYAGHGSIPIVAVTGVITFSGAIGSHCDVTEVSPPPGYSLPTTVTQTVTIGATQTVVSFLDPPAPGSLKIVKASPAAGTFTFNIACTNPTNAYVLNVPANDPAGATQSGIPAGSVCTITEVVPAGFAQPVFSPSNVVTIITAQTVTVSVSNSLLPGAIKIVKSAPAGSPSTFTFNIDCVSPTNHYVLVVPTNDLSGVTQSGIPAGSVCTITEVIPAGFAQPTFSPSNIVTVLADQTVTVSVANALLPGSLTIAKASPAGGPESFTFDVVCTGVTPFQLVVPANGSATKSDLPAGSVCTITEDVPDGFAQPTFDPSNVATIVAGQTVTVNVTNTLLPLGILIEKSATPISGTPGTSVTYTYKVTNTGDVTLIDISVDDDKLGHIGDIASLEPGESATLTFDTTLPNAAGLLTNVATAVGSDEFGREATDTDDFTVTIVLAVTPLRRTLPKTGAGVGMLAAFGIALLASGFLFRVLAGRRLLPAPAMTPAGTAILSQVLRTERRAYRGRGWFRGPRDRAGP